MTIPHRLVDFPIFSLLSSFRGLCWSSLVAVCELLSCQCYYQARVLRQSNVVSANVSNCRLISSVSLNIYVWSPMGQRQFNREPICWRWISSVSNRSFGPTFKMANGCSAPIQQTPLLWVNNWVPQFVNIFHSFNHFVSISDVHTQVDIVIPRDLAVVSNCPK